MCTTKVSFPPQEILKFEFSFILKLKKFSIPTIFDDVLQQRRAKRKRKKRKKTGRQDQQDNSDQHDNPEDEDPNSPKTISSQESTRINGKNYYSNRGQVLLFLFLSPILFLSLQHRKLF
jgi:hypothetical protein